MVAFALAGSAHFTGSLGVAIAFWIIAALIGLHAVLGWRPVAVRIPIRIQSPVVRKTARSKPQPSFAPSPTLAMLMDLSDEAQFLLMRAKSGDSMFGLPDFPADLARDTIRWKRHVEQALANDPGYRKHFSARTRDSIVFNPRPGELHPHAQELTQRVEVLHEIIRQMSEKEQRG